MSEKRIKLLKKFTIINKEALGLFFNIDIKKYDIFRKVKNYHRRYKRLPRLDNGN